MPEQLLSGWGRTAPSRASVVTLPADGRAGAVAPGTGTGPRPVPGGDTVAPAPANTVASALSGSVAEVLAGAGPRGVIPRGLGRSYNDAAQNGGGTVLQLPSARGGVYLDEVSGQVTCGAGVRLCDLIEAVLPRGWFPAVTPGTSLVTVGGMLASDVHGKNHHRDGSIGAHVRSMELVTPGQGVLKLGPEGPQSDWFWATIGGMGLTGVITEVTLQLLAVPGPRIRVVERRHRDLDDLMAGLAAADRHQYSVAWVDGTARGRRFGRGLVASGEHAPGAQAPRVGGPGPHTPGANGPGANAPGTRAHTPGRPAVRVPLTPPLTPLNRWTIQAFNEAWFRKPGTGERLTSVRSFFHPLDVVGDWNRLYGPRGFVQYQFVVPDASAQLVERALTELQRIGAASFLTVLKRFGAGNPAPLSFPSPGWTLALDLPAGVHGLARVLDDLDEQVAAAGGRVYLAKDGRARLGVLAAMYPRLDEWRAIRRQLDPLGVLCSDLRRRLGL